nr:hypothetical protein [Maliibacterium massiliense]
MAMEQKDMQRDADMMGKTGWTRQENALLEQEMTEALAQGRPLKSVFDRVAERTGRKPNSIRNYYYTTFRAQQQGSQTRLRAPFDTFTPDEIRTLLERVLEAQARGVSVRKCTMEMGAGDRSAMLRYQNKYRSLIKNRPALVREVMADMQRQGKPVYDPYARMTGLHPQMDVAVGDEAQARKVAAGLWHRLERQFAQLPVNQVIPLMQGLSALASGVLRAPQSRASQEKMDGLAAQAEWAQMRLAKAQARLEQLQQENDGLVRQLEMMQLPYDGDAQARAQQLTQGASDLMRAMRQQSGNMTHFAEEITDPDLPKSHNVHKNG